MISIAVCEDEPYFSEKINGLINRYFEDKKIEISVRNYVNGEEFLISGLDADIVLMDIELPGLDGMKVVERLRNKGNHAQVIFVTVYREYVFQAFDVEAIHFPVSTGNAVLDILLKEKLSYAVREGVEVSCNVKIPEDVRFDDMDLCIIFANILDNAIHACMNNSCEKSEISICAKARARFLVIEAINTMPVVQPVNEGIGLTNVRNVAKKYLGTVEIAVSNGRFRITVLLCSS